MININITPDEGQQIRETYLSIRLIDERTT